MTTKRYVEDGRPTTCAYCGGPLSPRQRYNHNRACPMRCREALKSQQYPPRVTACEYCGKALSPSAQRERRRHCSRECGQRSRTHRPAPMPPTRPRPRSSLLSPHSTPQGHCGRSRGACTPRAA